MLGLSIRGSGAGDFADFAERADRIIALSADMVERLQPHLAKPISIWRPERDLITPSRIPEIIDGEVLRIAVLGALNIAKGSKVIADLGTAIAKRGAPVIIDVFGESPQHAMLFKAGVFVHGRYKDDDIQRLLSDRNPHVAFLPAIWPETWSFVLTRLVALRLPVFAFDHGAQAERLRATGKAETILPSKLVSDPEALLDVFLKFRRSCIEHSRSKMAG